MVNSINIKIESFAREIMQCLGQSRDTVRNSGVVLDVLFFADVIRELFPIAIDKHLFHEVRYQLPVFLRLVAIGDFRGTVGLCSAACPRTR